MQVIQQICQFSDLSSDFSESGSNVQQCAAYQLCNLHNVVPFGAVPLYPIKPFTGDTPHSEKILYYIIQADLLHCN